MPNVVQGKQAFERETLGTGVSDGITQAHTSEELAALQLDRLFLSRFDSHRRTKLDDLILPSVPQLATFAASDHVLTYPEQGALWVVGSSNGFVFELSQGEGVDIVATLSVCYVALLVDSLPKSVRYHKVCGRQLRASDEAGSLRNSKL